MNKTQQKPFSEKPILKYMYSFTETKPSYFIHSVKNSIFVQYQITRHFQSKHAETLPLICKSLCRCLVIKSMLGMCVVLVDFQILHLHKNYQLLRCTTNNICSSCKTIDWKQRLYMLWVYITDWHQKWNLRLLAQINYQSWYHIWTNCMFKLFYQNLLGSKF